METQVASGARLLCIGIVVGENHTALTGGDDLVRIEAEATDVAEAAALAPPVLGAMRLRGILDDDYAVLVCEGSQRIHVHGVSIDVHRHYRPRARRDLRLNLTHVHAPRVRVAID